MCHHRSRHAIVREIGTLRRQHNERGQTHTAVDRCRANTADRPSRAWYSRKRPSLAIVVFQARSASESGVGDCTLWFHGLCKGAGHTLALRKLLGSKRQCARRGRTFVHQSHGPRLAIEPNRAWHTPQSPGVWKQHWVLRKGHIECFSVVGSEIPVDTHAIVHAAALSCAHHPGGGRAPHWAGKCPRTHVVFYTRLTQHFGPKKRAGRAQTERRCQRCVACAHTTRLRRFLPQYPVAIPWVLTLGAERVKRALCRTRVRVGLARPAFCRIDIAFVYLSEVSFVTHTIVGVSRKTLRRHGRPHAQERKLQQHKECGESTCRDGISLSH